MNFRPSDDLALKLKTQADAEHVSVQHLLVKAAEEYLIRHDREQRVKANTEQIKARFGDALRRLGE